MYTIYKLTSPSGKLYIGQTKNDPTIRFEQHVDSWINWIDKGKPHKTGYQPKLMYAFDKHGPENFTQEIITKCDDITSANILEEAYIKQFNSVDNGYNVQNGGGGWNKLELAESHKERIGSKKKAWWDSEAGQKFKNLQSERLKRSNPGAAANRGKPAWNSGKTYSELFGEERAKEANIKRSEAIKIHLTEEFRQERRLSTKEMWEKGIYDNRPPISEETKLKLSKKFLITDPQGKQFEIVNLEKFCKENNLATGNIRYKYGSKGYKAIKIQ